MFLIILILVTILKIIYSINNIESNYNEDTKSIIGIVTDIDINDDKTKMTIKAKENILIYYYNDIDVNLGDKIKVIGNFKKIDENTIFNIFNYKKYMLSKNTYYKIDATNIMLLEKNKNVLYKAKRYLINRINKIERSDYLKLFILGDNGYIDEEVKNSYNINGISHLFSGSGTP